MPKSLSGDLRERLRALEDGRHVLRADAAIGIGVACAVAHRNRMVCRECNELLDLAVEKNIVTDEQRARSKSTSLRGLLSGVA